MAKVRWINLFKMPQECTKLHIAFQKFPGVTPPDCVSAYVEGEKGEAMERPPLLRMLLRHCVHLLICVMWSDWLTLILLRRIMPLCQCKIITNNTLMISRDVFTCLQRRICLRVMWYCFWIRLTHRCKTLFMFFIYDKFLNVLFLQRLLLKKRWKMA